MILRLLPYRLPLRRPWRSAHGTVHERQGWLVVAEQDRILGYGDCSPLPEAGTETLPQAASRLTDWQACAKTQSCQSLLDDLTAALPSPSPAADAAVECALLDWQSRTAGLPLRCLLHQDTATKTAERVAVNAALGALMTCQPETLEAKRASGFRVFKLKVGADQPAAELAILRDLLPMLASGEQLRLDANRAWDFESASVFLREVERMAVNSSSDLARIESLEEPLRDADDSALAQLQRQTRIPLALDESLPRRPWPILAHQLPVRRIVLKPGALGGLRPAMALAKAAISAGIEPVITSMIDSAAGLWATAQLAAAVDATVCQQSALPLCHGLDTADWLLEDLGHPARAVAGYLTLPNQPGSGFVPNSTNSFARVAE